MFEASPQRYSPQNAFVDYDLLDYALHKESIWVKRRRVFAWQGEIGEDRLRALSALGVQLHVRRDLGIPSPFTSPSIGGKFEIKP